MNIFKCLSAKVIRSAHKTQSQTWISNWFQSLKVVFRKLWTNFLIYKMDNFRISYSFLKAAFHVLEDSRQNSFKVQVPQLHVKWVWFIKIQIIVTLQKLKDKKLEKSQYLMLRRKQIFSTWDVTRLFHEWEVMLWEPLSSRTEQCLFLKIQLVLWGGGVNHRQMYWGWYTRCLDIVCHPYTGI